MKFIKATTGTPLDSLACSGSGIVVGNKGQQQQRLAATRSREQQSDIYANCWRIKLASNMRTRQAANACVGLRSASR